MHDACILEMSYFRLWDQIHIVYRVRYTKECRFNYYCTSPASALGITNFKINFKVKTLS